jgi:hypothetical protein
MKFRENNDKVMQYLDELYLISLFFTKSPATIIEENKYTRHDGSLSKY